jgi:hypothetical protein
MARFDQHEARVSEAKSGNLPHLAPVMQVRAAIVPIEVSAPERAFVSTQSLDRHVVGTPDTLGGKARIAGRRISVEDIAI